MRVEWRAYGTALQQKYAEYTGATQNGIWANLYEADNGWGEPIQLQTMPVSGTLGRPVILIDNSNNAIAAWNRFFGNESQIWGSMYINNNDDLWPFD